MVKERKYKIPEECLRGVSGKNKLVLVNYLTHRSRPSLELESNTIINDRDLILTLARCLKEKMFKNTSKEDMMDFFDTISEKSRNLYGTKIILFYRWLFELDKREIPENMKWFTYTTKAKRLKRLDPELFKKCLITPEQYDKIMKITIHPQVRAMFETLYLGGMRPSELTSMKISGVKIDGVVEVTVMESKTIPRVIPLSEIPHNLLHWCDIHPNKDDPDKPLWYTLSRREEEYKRLNRWGVADRLQEACSKAGIIRHTPKHFRSTRATIMFSERSKDGGLIWSNGQIGKFFGWSPERVDARREQYDMSGYEDLKETMRKRVGAGKSIIEKARERDTEVEVLKKEIAELKNREANRKEEFSRMLDKKLEDIATGKYKPHWVEQKVKKEKD